MVRNLRLPRRVDGASGPPNAGDFLAGQMALNFPGAAGGGLTPELWAHDGAVFRRVNPSGTTVRSAQAGPDQGTVHDTFTADAIDVGTGDIVVYTYGGSTWIFTGNPGSPAVAADGDLVRVGAFPVYASSQETLAGTVADKAVTPSALQARTLVTPSATPANDADRLVRLGSNGRLHPNFVFRFYGDVNMTTAVPGGLVPTGGTWVRNTTAGVPAGSWNFHQAPSWVGLGDSAYYDGSRWHHLANAGAFNGGRMRAAAKIEWPGAVTAEAGNVLLDLKGGTIDNAVISGGTF